jgi:transcriptional regulator with XRE-family HTH domain
MKDRIIQFSKEMNLTSTKFADQIGVQRSSISHLLSGRNKPSFDFIEKMLNAYPDVNAQWLITGKGNMLNNQPSLFHSNDQNKGKNLTTRELDINNQPLHEHLISQSDEISTEKDQKIDLHKQKHHSIERIVIFYSDNTFKEYKSI